VLILVKMIIMQFDQHLETIVLQLWNIYSLHVLILMEKIMMQFDGHLK